MKRGSALKRLQTAFPNLEWCMDLNDELYLYRDPTDTQQYGTPYYFAEIDKWGGFIEVSRDSGVWKLKAADGSFAECKTFKQLVFEIKRFLAGNKEP